MKSRICCNCYIFFHNDCMSETAEVMNGMIRFVRKLGKLRKNLPKELRKMSFQMNFVLKTMRKKHRYSCRSYLLNLSWLEALRITVICALMYFLSHFHFIFYVSEGRGMSLMSMANVLHRTGYSRDASILVRSSLHYLRDKKISWFSLGNIFAVSYVVLCFIYCCCKLFKK